MFGKTMSIKGKCGMIRLAPFKQEEIANERVCTMLSEHEVTRYIIMNNSPTIDDEKEFYENIVKDKRTIHWGIYLDRSELLGTTTINQRGGKHLAYTGFMLFDKSYWGKGIASAAHVARTYYAVNNLDIKTIGSNVYSPNIGSLKALQSVGYFITGCVFGAEYIDGIYRNLINLQWIRPGYEKLILADKDNVPKEISPDIENAMKIAKKTLKKGKKEVRF